MDVNQSVLMTERLYSETYYLFLSSLAGSILGITGAIGFLMRQIERNYLIIEDKINHKALMFAKKLKRRQIKNCFEPRKYNSEVKLRNHPRLKNNVLMMRSTHLSIVPERVLMLINSPLPGIDVPNNSMISHNYKKSTDSMSSEIISSMVVQDNTHIESKYYDHRPDEIITKPRYNQIRPI